MRLKDKAVIITGGAGGIGSGMARAMAKEGAKVAIVDLNEEQGNAVVTELQKISPDSMFIKADLTERKNCMRLSILLWRNTVNSMCL